MNRRSRELANRMARAALARAEQAQPDDPDVVAERLREAADQDGRIDLDAAVAAVRGEPDEPTFNALLHQPSKAAVERQAAARERLFPTPESEEPTGKPTGDADGGKGEDDGAIYEDGEHGRIRVWPLDDNPNTKEDA